MRIGANFCINDAKEVFIKYAPGDVDIDAGALLDGEYPAPVNSNPGKDGRVPEVSVRIRTQGYLAGGGKVY